MKTREFFLLLLIIAAGVLLTHYDSGELENWTWDLNWDWDGPFFRLGQTHTYQETSELAPPFSQTLEVVNEHGSVDIQGGATDKISITLEKTIWRRKEEDARRTAATLSLLVKDDGQKVLVTVNRRDFERRNFETHFTLSVPEGLKVTVRNSYGRVKTVMTGDTTVANSHGAVEARDIKGIFSCQNSYEDVEVMGVASDCFLSSRHASLLAARVKGRLQVEHRYGEIRLEDISGEVTVNAPHSEVTGLRLAGTVKVESSYNPISLTEVGAVLVTGHHSEVRAAGVRGDTDISNTYGRAEVTDASGRVVIRGENMEVLGQNLSGPEISIVTTYQDIFLSNFSGKTTISQKHGGLRLEPSSFGGELRVEAEYCPIELAWPSSARSPIECQTRNGDINWELSADPSLKKTNGVSLLKAFPGETGKPLIYLSTTYADITIEESHTTGQSAR